MSWICRWKGLQEEMRRQKADKRMWATRLAKAEKERKTETKKKVRKWCVEGERVIRVAGRRDGRFPSEGFYILRRGSTHSFSFVRCSYRNHSSERRRGWVSYWQMTQEMKIQLFCELPVLGRSRREKCNKVWDMYEWKRVGGCHCIGEGGGKREDWGKTG